MDREEPRKAVSDGATPERKGRTWWPTVLRNRSFARLFFAGATSAGGFAIGQVGLIVLVYNTTHSPLDIAYIGGSFFVASIIFSLVAGALVDRHNRRKLMVLSDLARAGSLAVLIACLVVFGFSLAVVLGVAFVLGSFTTLFQPAARAFTPEVVGNEQLANANALVQSSNSVIQFASSGAGGVLVGVLGAVAAFSINMLTFLISAILIVGIAGFIGPKRLAPDGKGPPSMMADLREGFRYIIRNRALLALTVSAGLANFFFAMALQFFVVYAEDALHGGTAVYGFLNGLFILGFAPGAYLAAHFRTVRFAGWTYILSGVADGICIVGLVAFPNIATAFFFAFMIGVLLGLLDTTWLTTVQLVVPSEMQGRYFGLDQLGSFAVIPVGQVLGGIIITANGIGTDYTIAGLGMMMSTGLFVLSPHLRKLRWNQAAQQ